VRARRRRFGSGGASDDPEAGGGPKLGGSRGGSDGGGGGDGGGDADQQRHKRSGSRSSSARALQTGGGGSGGGGGQGRRQVAPQPHGAPDAAAAPRAQLTERRDAEVELGAVSELRQASSGGGGSVRGSQRHVPSPRSESDQGAPRTASGAGEAAHLHRGMHSAAGALSSGSASPHLAAQQAAAPPELSPWVGGELPAHSDEAAAAPLPHRPRHQPAGSAGSAHDILLGRVALEGAASFGAAVAASRAAAAGAHHAAVSASTASSLAARHTPSSSQESVSVDSPHPPAGRHVRLGSGEVTSVVRAPPPPAAWRQHSASGSGRWQTIEGLEGGHVGGAPVGSDAAAGGHRPLASTGEQQQQQQPQPQQPWAASGSDAAAYVDAGRSALPHARSVGGRSPWRPGSSSGAAQAPGPLSDEEAAPRGPPRARGAGRHHHSLSASLPIGGTLSEWADVRDPAPGAPLYSPAYYAGGHPLGSATTTPKTPSSGLLAPVGATPLPSVQGSAGSTASSDVGRAGGSDQSHAPGAPPSPLLAGDADRLRSSYRSSMRKVGRAADSKG
jgi:hypothetical protein